jgi:methyl-accepting chemotaxis protein
MADHKEHVLNRAQLPIFYLTLVNALVLAVGAFLILNKALFDSLTEKEKLLTVNLATVLSDPLSIGEYDRLNQILRSAKEQDKDMEAGTIVSQDGQVIATTEENLKNSKLDKSDVDKAALERTTFAQQSTDRKGVYEDIAPISAAGSKVGVLRLTFSDKRAQLVIQVAEWFIIFLTLLILLSKLYFLRRALTSLFIEPITKAGMQAGRISQGELGEPLVKKYDDEIGVLVDSMNDMTDYLREMANLANSIARGDLSVTVQPKSQDDMFGNAFKKMVDSLYEIIHTLSEDAQNLSATATQLATTSSQQTTIISQQAASIQESLVTLEEIRMTVNQASEKAKSVVSISDHTLEVSKAGQQALSQAIQGMTKIKDQVEIIAKNIFELTTKTAQIGEITASVNDIAEQSKLLSVNAAIEAVKAGEFGKGFGVVASEVKSLANESKRATAQVHSILDEIQRATTSTALVTEEGTKRAESGVNEIRQIGENFNRLYQVILESSNAAKQIASVTYQQVTGIEQINMGMSSISEAANESVIGAQQQSSTAQNLSSLAARMNQIVKQYRLKS